MDVHKPEIRSKNMSAIKRANTLPELLIRKALHHIGYRYRLNVKEIPGTPDIVLPRLSSLIFVHGCFWHGHDCHLFKLPASRREFWSNKISKTQKTTAGTFKHYNQNGE